MVGAVPGTHITMLSPPQVAVLAEKLVAVLAAGEGAQNAQGTGASGAGAGSGFRRGLRLMQGRA